MFFTTDIFCGHFLWTPFCGYFSSSFFFFFSSFCYWCFYLNRSRVSASPVFGIFSCCFSSLLCCIFWVFLCQSCLLLFYLLFLGFSQYWYYYPYTLRGQMVSRIQDIFVHDYFFVGWLVGLDIK